MSTIQASRSRADSPQMMEAAPSSKPTTAAVAGPNPSPEQDSPSPASSPTPPPPPLALADETSSISASISRSRSRASTATPPMTTASAVATIADARAATDPLPSSPVKATRNRSSPRKFLRSGSKDITAMAGNGGNGADKKNEEEEARDEGTIGKEDEAASSRGGGGGEEEREPMGDIDTREPSELTMPTLAGGMMEDTAVKDLQFPTQFDGMRLPSSLGRVPSLKRTATDTTNMTEKLIARAEHTIGMDILEEVASLSEEPTMSMHSTSSSKSKGSVRSSRSMRSTGSNRSSGSKKSTGSKRSAKSQTSEKSAGSKKSVKSAASDHMSVATDAYMDECAKVLADDNIALPKALPSPILEEPPSPVAKAEEVMKETSKENEPISVQPVKEEEKKAQEAKKPPIVPKEKPAAVLVEGDAKPAEEKKEAPSDAAEATPPKESTKAKMIMKGLSMKKKFPRSGNNTKPIAAEAEEAKPPAPSKDELATVPVEGVAPPSEEKKETAPSDAAEETLKESPKAKKKGLSMKKPKFSRSKSAVEAEEAKAPIAHKEEPATVLVEHEAVEPHVPVESTAESTASVPKAKPEIDDGKPSEDEVKAKLASFQKTLKFSKKEETWFSKTFSKKDASPIGPPHDEAKESKSKEEEKPIVEPAQSGPEASIVEPSPDKLALLVAKASTSPVEKLDKGLATESAAEPTEDKTSTEEARKLVADEKVVVEEEKKEGKAPPFDLPDAMEDAYRDLDQTETTSVAEEAIKQVKTDEASCAAKSSASKSSASKSKRRIKSLSMKKLQMGIIVDSVKETTEKKRVASPKSGSKSDKDSEKQAVKKGPTSPSNFSAKAKLRASKRKKDSSVVKSKPVSPTSDKSNRSKFSFSSNSSRKSLLSKRMSSIRKRQGSKDVSEMADEVLGETAENKQENTNDSGMVAAENKQENTNDAGMVANRAAVDETIGEEEKPAVAETNEDEAAVAVEQAPVDTSSPTMDVKLNPEDGVTEPKDEDEDMAGELPEAVHKKKEKAIASSPTPISPTQIIGEGVDIALDEASKAVDEARGGMVGFINSFFSDPAAKPASESDKKAKEEENLQTAIEYPVRDEAKSDMPDNAKQPRNGSFDDPAAKVTTESDNKAREEENLQSAIEELVKTKQKGEEATAAEEDKSKAKEEEKPIAKPAQSAAEASIADRSPDALALMAAKASTTPPVDERAKGLATESVAEPAGDKSATEEAIKLVAEEKAAAAEEEKKEDKAPIINSPDAMEDACRDLDQTETTSIAEEAVKQVVADEASCAANSSATKSKRRIKSLSMKKLQMGVIMDSVKETSGKKRVTSAKTIKDTEKHVVKKGPASPSNFSAKAKWKSNTDSEKQAVKKGPTSPSNFMTKAKLRASKLKKDSSVSVKSMPVSPTSDKSNRSKFSFSSNSSRKSLLSKRMPSIRKTQGSKGASDMADEVLDGTAENKQDNTNDKDMVANLATVDEKIAEEEKPAVAETNEDEAVVAVEQAPVDTSPPTSDVRLNPKDGVTKPEVEDEDMAGELPEVVHKKKEKAIASSPRPTSPTQSIGESVASAVDEASKVVEEARGGMVGFISSLFSDPAAKPASESDKKHENFMTVIKDPARDEAKREMSDKADQPKNGSFDDPAAKATTESNNKAKEEENVQSAIKEPVKEEAQPGTPDEAEQTKQEVEEAIPEGESNQETFSPLPSPRQNESIELFAQFASFGPSRLTSAKPQGADESTSSPLDKPLGSYPMINFASSPKNEGGASTDREEVEAIKKVEAEHSKNEKVSFKEDVFLKPVAEEAPNLAEQEMMAKMLTAPAASKIQQKHTGRIRSRGLSPMKKFRMSIPRATNKDTDNSTITTAPSQKVSKKKMGKIGVLGKKKVMNPLRKSSEKKMPHAIPFARGVVTRDTSPSPAKVLPNEEHTAADAFSTAASVTNSAGKAMKGMAHLVLAKSTSMEKDAVSAVSSKKQAGKAKLERAMKVLKEKQAAASSKREVARERADKKTVLEKELDEELRHLKVEKRKLKASYNDKRSFKENAKKQQAMEKMIQDQELEAAKKKAEIAQAKLDQAKAEQEATRVEAEALEARVEAKRVLEELKEVKLRAEKEQKEQQIRMQKMLQEQHLQQLQMQTNAAEQMKALQSQTQKWQMEQIQMQQMQQMEQMKLQQMEFTQHAAQMNSDIEQKKKLKQLEFEHQTERMNSEIVQQRLLRAEAEAAAERAKAAKTKAELEAAANLKQLEEAANAKAAKEAAKNARASPSIQDAFRCMQELSFKEKEDQTLVSELTGHIQLENNKAYQHNTSSHHSTDKCGVECNSSGLHFDCGGLSSFEDTVQGFLQWFMGDEESASRCASLFECSEDTHVDDNKKDSGKRVRTHPGKLLNACSSV